MPRGSLVWLSCRSRVTQRRRLPACAPSALGPLHGRWGLGCSGAPWLLGVPWHTPASGPCTCWGCCWRAHVAALLGFPPPAFSGGSPQPGRGPPPGPSSLLCVCPACLCPVCPGAGSHAVSLRRGGQGRKTPAPEGTNSSSPPRFSADRRGGASHASSHLTTGCGGSFPRLVFRHGH